MTKIKDIINYTESFAPSSLAEEWDNVGLLVGDDNNEVTKVILTLDITNDVIYDAKEKNANLIISHHPVIFNPITNLHTNHPVYNLAKNEISALCLHTNLDKSENGVNVALANKLNLNNLDFHLNDYAIIGELQKEYTSIQFASYIKKHLNVRGIKYTKGRPIKRILISSGGAGDTIFKFPPNSFDAFVTGDMKHHEFLYAKEHQISAYEAGHFNTENVIIEPLKQHLSEKFIDVTFIVSDKNIDPNQYY